MNFFSNNIELLTESKNFSWKEFNAATGTSQDDLSSIEKINMEQLIKISSYFHITMDALCKQNLSEKRYKKSIKMLILDVDGVMTDGGMYYTEKGDDLKRFHTKDGMGIKTLCKNGFPVGIISASFSSELVVRRAKALGMKHIYVGKREKLEVLNDWCKELNISTSDVAYIGDDVNDLRIMKAVGVSACPKDAVSIVKSNADIILNRKGGKACVREFIDLYIQEITRD